MSAATIKRHNHKILHCNTERKIELINYLLNKYDDISIVIVTKDGIEALKDIKLNQNVIITSDETFDSIVTKEFDMLINFDLPLQPAHYLHRLELAGSYSFIILDPTELPSIYPIEMLIGRTLIQEMIKEFETLQSKEEKILLEKQKKKEKRYLKENQAKKEKQEQNAQKKLPPKRNVRRIVSKEQD